MDNLLPTNEYKEIEERQYLNPQVQLDESNTFIDNLRASQGQQNQEIFTDTQRLGTDISSDLGGLTGANSYFTSRYQTPQTASAVANLRATAQAQALNEVLANEQAIWKKRYQDAYRAAQRRAYNRSYGGGGGTTGDVLKTTTGGVDENPTDDKTTITYSSELTGIPGKQNIVDAAGNMLVYDPVTRETTVVEPSATTQHGYAGEGGGGGGWGGR